MNASGIKSLHDFIAYYQLKKPNGVTAFEAIINFYTDETPCTINSEVQIITLPEILVIYITEFFKDVFPLPEMYSTEDFYIKYSEDRLIEIYRADNTEMCIVSIKPALL